MAEVIATTATSAAGTATIDAASTGTTQAPDPKPEESGKGLKYTDADVDKIISQKFAKWQADQEKKIEEAEKLARMNEAEKATYEKEALEKELAQLKSEKTRFNMAGIARGMLKEQEITAPDEIINKLISEDAEETKKAVESFAQMFKAAVSAAVKEALRGEPPKTGAASGITKADIEAVKDRAERQKLINENLHLYRRN